MALTTAVSVAIEEGVSSQLDILGHVQVDLLYSEDVQGQKEVRRLLLDVQGRTHEGCSLLTIRGLLLCVYSLMMLSLPFYPYLAFRLS